MRQSGFWDYGEQLARLLKDATAACAALIGATSAAKHGHPGVGNQRRDPLHGHPHAPGRNRRLDPRAIGAACDPRRVDWNRISASGDVEIQNTALSGKPSMWCAGTLMRVNAVIVCRPAREFDENTVFISNSPCVVSGGKHHHVACIKLLFRSVVLAHAQ